MPFDMQDFNCMNSHFYTFTRWINEVFKLVIHQLNYINKLFIETHTAPPSLLLLDQSLSLNLAQFKFCCYVGQWTIFFILKDKQKSLNFQFLPQWSDFGILKTEIFWNWNSRLDSQSESDLKIRVAKS